MKMFEFGYFDKSFRLIFVVEKEDFYIKLQM